MENMNYQGLMVQGTVLNLVLIGLFDFRLTRVWLEHLCQLRNLECNMRTSGLVLIRYIHLAVILVDNNLDIIHVARLIVCTSCKASYHVLSHTHVIIWWLGDSNLYGLCNDYKM